MVLISLISVLNLLYVYISTFRTMCAVLNMAVFCSSLTSWFPGMLLTYFLNDFELIPLLILLLLLLYFDCYIESQPTNCRAPKHNLSNHFEKVIFDYNPSTLREEELRNRKVRLKATNKTYSIWSLTPTRAKVTKGYTVSSSLLTAL